MTPRAVQAFLVSSRRWVDKPARMKLAAAICALLVALVAPARAENYALLVAVNDCPQFRLPGGTKPRPLSGAENDVAQLAELLTGQFGFAAERVHVLRGAQATRAALLAELADFAKKLRPDDQFVLHFCGHGTQLPDANSDEEDGLDEALCLYDATEDGQNLLVDDELGRWLAKLPTRRATVILDCCHSGTGTKDVDEDIVPRYLPLRAATEVAQDRSSPRQDAWLELRGTGKSLDREQAALFACGPDQQAYERRIPGNTPGTRHGQFSYYLIDALRDNRADVNKDGTVSVREALAYVSERLDDSFNSKRAQPADRQQPTAEADQLDRSLVEPAR